MKLKISIALFVTALAIGSHAEVTIYENSFDDAGALDDFSIFTKKASGLTRTEYSLPSPQVKVENSQLKIDGEDRTDNYLIGLDLRSVGSSYQPILNNNAEPISWSFNVSNQNDGYNSGFRIILASTVRDPLEHAIGQGYAFQGGNYVGDRMLLTRFNLGADGNREILLDIPDSLGLGTLPEKGSYRITYTPQSGTWEVFGSVTDQYLDPTGTLPLIGQATDSVYANVETPYMGFAGSSTGIVNFDNLSLSTIPEPSSIALVCIIGGISVFVRRRIQE